MGRIAERVAQARTPGPLKKALNIRGSDVGLDVANFDGGLGSDDTDLQTAIETLDDATAAASEGATGVTELATTAEVRSAASGNLAVTAAKRKDAAAAVALSDAATVSVNWESGVYFTLEITANRTLGNPTNEMPGTEIRVLVAGDDGTDRTLIFGNEYGGDVPTLDDITSTKKYLLSVFCKSAGQFLVTSIDATDA